MATAGANDVACSLVQAETLELKGANLDPVYSGLVVLSQEKIFIVDWKVWKVCLHSLQDGCLLAVYNPASRPRDICVCNKDENKMALCLESGGIEILSVKFTNQTEISRIETLDVKTCFDSCLGVKYLNKNLVVSGLKKDSYCWGVVSITDGQIETVHKICKRGEYAHIYLCTNSNDMVFISCWAGDENPDMAGVYGYRNSRREFLYQHKDLKYPRGVAMDRRHVYVCNENPPCIHEMTESGQPLTIHTQGIQPSSGLFAIHWNQHDGLLYVISEKSNVITRFRPEYSDHQDLEQDYRLQRLARVLTKKQSVRDRVGDGKEVVFSPRGDGTSDSSESVSDEDQVMSPSQGRRTPDINTNVADKEQVKMDPVRHVLTSDSNANVADDVQGDITPNSNAHVADKDPMKEMIKLLQENSDKLKQDTSGTSPLSIWDFAGQFSFYTTHQTFLTRRAIYLLVSDVSGQITDIVDDECYFDSEGITKCRVHDLHDVWLNSIHSCSASTEAGVPPVILVGTHVDKIKQKQLPAKGIEMKTQTMSSETKEFTLPTKSTPDAATTKEQNWAWSVLTSVKNFFTPRKTKGTVGATSVSSITGAQHLPAEDPLKKQRKYKKWQGKAVTSLSESVGENIVDADAQEINHHEICERYFSEIRTYLSDKPTRFHLVDKEFAIDNTIVDSKLEDLKRKIVEVASKQYYWGEDIPTRWIVLEQELMRLKSAGVKVITRSLLEDLNKAGAVPIATEELDLFLRFEHDIGTILYFSIEVLKDNIVLDPQWMIDAIKFLITAEMFVLRSAPAVADKWLVFKTSGKLSPELIDAIWTKEHNPNLHDKKEHILLLMEHLNIIAKPRCYSEDGSEIKVENYFLAPCMLKETTPKAVISPEPQLDTESSSVLCYIFIGKFLPPPIFHRLLASCVSHWPIAKKKSENLIFCGCCVFDIDRFHRLTVFFKGYIIFARVTRIGKTEKTPSSKVCIKVREFITMTLSNVIGYLGQGLQFKLAIQCPNSEGYSVDSLIKIADLQENVEVPCHFCDDSHVIMSHDVLKFWFQDERKMDSAEKICSRVSDLTTPEEYQTSLRGRALPPGKKYHAFFSFSSSDLQWVKKTVEELENDGFVCCEYDRDNTPGTPLLTFVDNNIRNAYKIVVVMSREAFQSNFVLHEIQMAMLQGFNESRNCVVPVLLEDCEVPGYLSVMNYVDARDSKRRETWWPKLLMELEPQGPVIAAEAKTKIDREDGKEKVDKGQSSAQIEMTPSVLFPEDAEDDKQGNFNEDRIHHLLSSESDLKDYISNYPTEACIKTLMAEASKLSSKRSMQIILDFIVQQFTERFKDRHIRIWAGEEIIGPGNVQTVLVCFYSGSCDISMEYFYDLKVIYRDYNKTDGESASARVRELHKINDLTVEHCDLVNKAITIHGESLFAKHSNLEAISAGGIISSKSKGFVEETCVILYCRLKGIIPFGEMPFPNRLKVNEELSIAVDVREGYFSCLADAQNNVQENRFYQERNDLNEPLRMGCSIGRAGSGEGGTCGPFVKINPDRIGFLTCAHVVLRNSELRDLPRIAQINPIGMEIVQPSDSDSSSSQYQYAHRLCGRVVSAVFLGDWSSPTSTERFGLDAAVIEITSRAPDTGEFVPIEELQLDNAGFSLDHPPKFDDGKMMAYPITRMTQRSVIKVGSETGMTRGLLRLTKGMVRYSSREGNLQRANDNPEELPIIMHGLMEISPVNFPNNQFCTFGDSGAGVFLVDDDNSNKLICIGLSFGNLNDGTGLATPIDKILTALNRDNNLQITLKDFENEAVV